MKVDVCACDVKFLNFGESDWQGFFHFRGGTNMVHRLNFSNIVVEPPLFSDGGIRNCKQLWS